MTAVSLFGFIPVEMLLFGLVAIGVLAAVSDLGQCFWGLGRLIARWFRRDGEDDEG